MPLKKAGNEFKACCPFHQEKTPSFWVNDQKGFYHCFGCGVHGDAIRWLTDARGLPFVDAVKQLADECGLEMPKAAPEEIARQERAKGLHELMEAAAAYFQHSLQRSEGSDARDYLARRELGEAAWADFNLGYAPEGRNNIKGALTGFSEQQLIDAGLLVTVEEREPYDRFRNRVMVPIRDPRSRVIAFGGRILGDGEPKYLNSPDTTLFDKGRILYNLDRAGPASRQTGRIIVVEGYFDVIALDQAGVREAVAPMGTALTDTQLELLWRLVDEPILCFDGDKAGVRAAERGSHRAMPALRPGKQLRIALLPAGSDPDDLIRHRGRDAFEEIVSQALPLASFLYRSELNKIDPTRPEQRAALRTNLEELSGSCGDRFMAEEFSRTFRALFFEDFGWKAKQRQDVFKSVVRTSPRVKPDLARLFVRSALYGLTRFPSVASAYIEHVSQMPLAHPDLRRWRDAIGEAILIDPDLDEDGLRAILEAQLLPQTLQLDVRTDLRFGFTLKKTLREQAIKQLETLVTFLAEEKALEDHMAERDEAALAALEDGDRYAAIEVGRQRLREERIALLNRGANWDGELH